MPTASSSGRKTSRPVPPTETPEVSTSTDSEPAAKVEAQSPTAVLGTMDRPETTQPIELDVNYAVALTVIHIVGLIAFLPGAFSYLFSWTGLFIGIMGHFVFGMMGITIGYHRLLTHQGFKCAKWLEHSLAILGVCNLQDSPARWVAVHRVHHKHSDEQPDPHSPLVSLIWGHMGWLFVKNRDHVTVGQFEKYVRDILRDPFYMWLEKGSMWLVIYFLHALAFFAVGGIVTWIATGSFSAGLQMGLSLLVWGVFVRTIVVLHGTWAVNSLSHIWGYRNYETSDNSRNNWFVALISHGEGWHNNHHADQRAASHGHKSHELDMSWWVIRSLERCGLVWDVVRPRCWKKDDPETAVE